jgi:hypothetical protein
MRLKSSMIERTLEFDMPSVSAKIAQALEQENQLD